MMRERGFGGFHRDAQKRNRIQHDPVAQVAELAEFEQRAFAELGHVGHQRNINRFREGGEFFARGERFGKDPIGAGVDVLLRPVDGGVEVLDAAGIGAGDDDRAFIDASRGSGPDFAHIVSAVTSDLPER